MMKETEKVINQVGGNHYERMSIQPSILFRQVHSMTWSQENIIKYISRYKYKNGIQDIEKAMSYAEFAIKTKWASTIKSNRRAFIDKFIYGNDFDNFQKEVIRAAVDNRYHTVLELCTKKIEELSQ